MKDAEFPEFSQALGTDLHWHARHEESLTLGQRIADMVASGMGSWTFIICQTAIIVIWVIRNLIYGDPFDPWPFILLNLMLSLQAAYAAPLILISEKRHSERDRAQAEDDYRTNVEAERKIRELQIHLAKIEREKLDKILKHLGYEI